MVEKRSFPWVVVILFYLFLFPVSIWMMVTKIRTEVGRMAVNGQVMQVFGLVLVGLGFCSILGNDSSYLFDRRVLVIQILYFELGGLLIFYWGRQYRKRGLRLNKYRALCAFGRDVYLTQLASAACVPMKVVIKDLSLILPRGGIPYAHLDMSRQVLIFFSNSNPGDSGYTRPTQSTGTAEGQPFVRAPRSVICPNCGASNQVTPGQSSVCEYCGTQLQ